MRYEMKALAIAVGGAMCGFSGAGNAYVFTSGSITDQGVTAPMSTVLGSGTSNSGNGRAVADENTGVHGVSGGGYYYPRNVSGQSALAQIRTSYTNNTADAVALSYDFDILPSYVGFWGYPVGGTLTGSISFDIKVNGVTRWFSGTSIIVGDAGISTSHSGVDIYHDPNASCTFNIGNPSQIYDAYTCGHSDTLMLGTLAPGQTIEVDYLINGNISASLNSGDFWNYGFMTYQAYDPSGVTVGLSPFNATPAGNPAIVPLPSTVWLAGVSLLALLRAPQRKTLNTRQSDDPLS